MSDNVNQDKPLNPFERFLQRGEKMRLEQEAKDAVEEKRIFDEAARLNENKPLPEPTTPPPVMQGELIVETPDEKELRELSTRTNPVIVPAKRVMGKFEKGNKHNPYASGKAVPFIGEISKIRKALFQTIDKDTWIDIKEAWLQKCVKGDLKAIEMLLNFTIGKPTQIQVQAIAALDDPRRALDKLLGIDTSKTKQIEQGNAEQNSDEPE